MIWSARCNRVVFKYTLFTECVSEECSLIDDGAKGMLKLREAGAVTAAQDEKISVVFGMSKVALELKATDISLPIESIADFLIQKSQVIN
jgi:hypothetical protein